MVAKKRPRERREGATLMRLSAGERALVQRVAGREPLASFCRRVVLNYCERAEARRGKA